MMIKSAKEIVAAGETVEVVDFAIETNRQINALQKELDLLKAFIREKGIAAAALSGENNALVEGHLGAAQVAMVKAAPKARKGTDLLASEGSLPAEVFATLFVKKTVVEFAPDFEEKLIALPKAQRAVVANLVEMVASTPRVNLPK
jgi:hypothetical protein